ncbi:LysE family transporter [Helicobacter sp. MIT 14-3879]|uniref:LysE family transporter n=1 Tax=Helicobacter sp. MIT 14-3879 TaxID=2040649 RepID=UPI000E1F1A21|nr:LysE family transporter [Helicobacter sp. MIT 14-3879]RDU60204.1 lysine transporter LysE [Helicobacter sp. MIT 14-3879]
MGFETFLSLLVYMSITATTPGPNNILALSSVINYGYRESKRLILGIYAGFASIMILCGFGCHLLIEILPNMLEFLKILGVGYVLYLAYKVAISKPQGLESQNENLGFFNAFFLQFVNVKIILYAITIHISFVLPYYQSYFYTGTFVLLSIVVGFMGIFLWIIAGVALKAFLTKHYKIANFTMAALLVLSAVQILLG